MLAAEGARLGFVGRYKLLRGTSRLLAGSGGSLLWTRFVGLGLSEK